MAESKPIQKLFDNLLKGLLLGATFCVVIVGAIQIYPVQFGLVVAVAVLTGLVIWYHRRNKELQARNGEIQRDLDRARRW